MSRVAKTAVKEVDRRYLVGEHAAAPVFLLLMLGVAALLGVARLQEGFTTFLLSSAALPALGIGVLYECLFIFGTLIFLDHRPYSLAVPANNLSSLLAGVVASYVLAALVPAAVKSLPGTGQQLALIAVLCAIGMLAYPSIRRVVLRGSLVDVPQSRLVLFVCGGNTCRSPMAEAVCRELIAASRTGREFHVCSAGLSVTAPGAGMTREAIIALGELGIEVQHRSRHLTAELCQSAHVVYCMTAAQRDAVLLLVPHMADATFCLDPEADVSDPHGQPLAAHREFAGDLQRLIDRHVGRMPAFAASAAAAARA
jgi:protein-tyrosine-phosphatase